MLFNNDINCIIISINTFCPIPDSFIDILKTEGVN